MGRLQGAVGSSRSESSIASLMLRKRRWLPVGLRLLLRVLLRLEFEARLPARSMRLLLRGRRGRTKNRVLSGGGFEG